MSVLDNSVIGPAMTPSEFIQEFKHTWPRHEGYVTRAARVFDTRPDALVRRLYRYRSQGLCVDFIDDTRKWRDES